MYEKKLKVQGTHIFLSARCSELSNEDAREKGLMNLAPFQVFRCTDVGEHRIGAFVLAPMPGCCGAVVSTASHLNPDVRHSGLSDSFRELKQVVARDFGYSFMIMTTDMSNIPAVGNALKSRYKIVDTFMNKRTGHLIGVGVKKI